jgi:predicted SAM-dependent methyltransferase
MVHTRFRKLNLGCGDDHREGYVNVDLQPFHHPDLVANVLDLRDFPAGYYQEVLALGLIEHFKRVETRRALYEWNRVLQVGGRLILTTTYLNGLLRKMEEPCLQSVAGHEIIMETLFAGQLAEGDYHLTAFSELLMRYYLWECGFEIDQIGLMDGWLFEIEACKERDYSFVELLTEPDDRTFLRCAYQEILGRDLDPTGEAHYRGALATASLTRSDVLRTLLLSAERKQLMLARAPQFPRIFDKPTLRSPNRLVLLLRRMAGLGRALTSAAHTSQ